MPSAGKREGHKECILGYAIETRPADACVSDMVSWIRSSGECRTLACLNPHSYATACKDGEFASALRNATWLVPDGMGVVLGSLLLGGDIRARVTGPDIFAGVNKVLDASGGGRVYFLGSTDDNLAEIERRMTVEYPALKVVGTYSPPYRSSYTAAETAAMIDRINEATPDVLWVGLTAPKQEKWIEQNRARLKVPFAAGVGAVFDFYTGRVRRSSPLFQHLGLEWLPRLLKEPRRLWRRTLCSAPIFMAHVLRERLFRR